MPILAVLRIVGVVTARMGKNGDPPITVHDQYLEFYLLLVRHIKLTNNINYCVSVIGRQRKVRTLLVILKGVKSWRFLDHRFI